MNIEKNKHHWVIRSQYYYLFNYNSDMHRLCRMMSTYWYLRHRASLSCGTKWSNYFHSLKVQKAVIKKQMSVCAAELKR